MGELICVACGGLVLAQAGECDRCGNQLGAGQVAFRPVAAGAQPTDLDSAANSDRCATVGCDRPAMPRSQLCRECFVQASRGRCFTLLAPWSQSIALPDGVSLGLGRDPQFSPCAAQLAGESTVSRQHLLVWSLDGSLVARDLASNNGTLRNWDPMPSQVDVELAPGDCLTLGMGVTFVVSPL